MRSRSSRPSSLGRPASLWWAGLAIAAALAIAAPSHAGPAPFRNGQLEILLFGLDPVQVPPGAPLASGVLNATRTANSITAIGFPSKVFQTEALSVVITDPGADPIDGVLITAFNPSANFTAMGGGAGNFGGPMPLQGTAKVCLFSLPENPGCQTSVFNLTLPLSVVGDTGTAAVTFLADITVKGAPWTVGKIVIANAKGGATNVTGGIAPTTAGDGSYLGVKLVTPIYISTAITGSEVVPAWGVLSFEVPEPGVMALGLGAVGGLLAMGLRCRQI